MRDLKTFLIITYGCQMNELDSEVMAGALLKYGLTHAKSEQEADLIIFNTCSVRDLAEQKVIGKLGLLGKKKERPLLGIAGCMAAAKKERLFKTFPFLDFVIGPNNIGELIAVLQKVMESKKSSINVSETIVQEPDYLIAKRSQKVKAYVSIIRGCNKFCTYCIVPHTRGREVSRTPSDIIEECSALLGKGYQEIILLGQNVNSYGKDHPEWKCSFADLLARLNALSGLKRLRFLTSHPVDLTDELIDAFAALPTLCEFLHFPLQSGSNRILKKMNRHYTKEEYLDKIERLQKVQSKITFGTDIIVGFPTETEQDFLETYELFEKIKFTTAFIFAYSPREHTVAKDFLDDVSAKAKQERLQTMLSLFRTTLDTHLHSLIGQKREVLVEKINKDTKLLQGHTRAFEKVIFSGDSSLLGTLQTVQITDCKHQTLLANLIPQALND
jgi:tRNA-2-methylthio-N6-dimethylallyladenosine synthase